MIGGIALATAPAPALSIVNEYHTNGPVTATLLPLAAIVSGTIVAAAIINEIIAVVIAKYAFKRAGEITEQ